MSFADFGQPVTLSLGANIENATGSAYGTPGQHAHQTRLSAAEVTTRLTALPELTNRGRRGDIDDSIAVDATSDVVSGGSGTDTVRAAASFVLGADVENGVLLGTGPFSLTGNDLPNVLSGNDAANVMSGGGGSDVLNGGAGVDKLLAERVATQSPVTAARTASSAA